MAGTFSLKERRLQGSVLLSLPLGLACSRGGLVRSLLGDNSPWVCHVPVRAASEALTALCSRPSVQGPWKAEIKCLPGQSCIALEDRPGAFFHSKGLMR